MEKTKQELQPQNANEQVSINKFFKNENIVNRLNEILGEKTPGFISSVLQTVNNNYLLKKANPQSVFNACLTAAVLDLPINQNLGYAWIVPYKGEAQFQIGWKGFVQLALRTGQYRKINVISVYENQFNQYNRLTEEIDADFTIAGENKVVGYFAYFELINGFKKSVYWSKEEVIKHASMYSQTYGKQNKYGKLIHSPWNTEDQFDSMAMKTVLKNTLSKWGIMSIEMQDAVLSDQSVQKKENSYTYPDNPQTIDAEYDDIQEENNRILQHIELAKNEEELQMIKDSLDTKQIELFEEDFTNKEKTFK